MPGPNPGRWLFQLSPAQVFVPPCGSGGALPVPGKSTSVGPWDAVKLRTCAALLSRGDDWCWGKETSRKRGK